MARQAAHVITVEIDSTLAPLAQQEFSSFDNVTLIQEDALQSKNKLNPRVIETIRQQVERVPGGRLKLVANLPYNVATPILSNLLFEEPWPNRMVVTIQRELAERIAAKPSTKDYSALSVWIQSQCTVEIVRNMSPKVFWPQPKVESAIIDIRPQPLLRNRIHDRVFFHRLVRGLFLHRRKLMRSALLSAINAESTMKLAATEGKQLVDRILQELGWDTSCRAEQLTPLQLIELAKAVRPVSGEL